jgi:hypothetical protein
MIRQTILAIIMYAIFALALFGAAFLVGCTESKYAVKCTIAQSENCN